MWDDILESFGIKNYDELNPVERETFHKMLETVERAQISLEDVKIHIRTIRQAVENELATHNLSKEQDLYLKARLKNYILLEALLDSPERARKALDQYIKSKK